MKTRFAKWAQPLARASALFIGLFFLVSLFRTFNATEWLLDFRGAPFEKLAEAAMAVLLIAFAFKPLAGTPRRFVSTLTIRLALLVAFANVAEFFFLLVRGAIATRAPLPLSLFVAAILGVILWVVLRPRVSTPKENVATAASFGALLIVFPLAQMLFFGETDYRRQADAAVVFGARTYADGRISDALADRVRTACELYKAGLVSTLIMSGGPGEGAIHETEAMRAYAMRKGVPESSILLDKDGLNTASTMRNLDRLARIHHFRKILAVSQSYHLPRIKLAAQKRGLAVYTVPARGPQILAKLPFFMARETAAWWAYFIRPE